MSSVSLGLFGPEPYPSKGGFNGVGGSYMWIQWTAGKS